MNNSFSSASFSIRRTIGLVRTGSAALAAVAVISIAAAPPASAAVGHPSVYGHLDVVSAARAQISVKGWSVDPTRSAAANSEIVVVDGVMASLPIANRPRLDVDRAFSISGSHGFSVAVPAGVGLHRVCVISRPLPETGGKDTVLGCRSVRVQS